MVRKLKTLIKKLGKRVKLKKHVIIQPEQAEDLDAAREKQVGYLQVDKALETIRADEAERELLKRKKVNVNKVLTQEQLKLLNEDFIGMFSLKKLFSHYFKGKKIFISSWDMKRVFGDFDDVVILKDGRVGIKLKQYGRPIITGRTARDVFHYFPGLAYNVVKGIVPINLDNEGRYAENVLQKEVPNIVTGADGKAVISKVETEPLMNLIVEKDKQISELHTYTRLIERHAMRSHAEQRKLEGDVEANITRAETAEAIHSKNIRKMKGMVKTYDQLHTELAKTAEGKRIAELRYRQWNAAKNQWLRKVRELLPKDVVDRNMEELKRLFIWQQEYILKSVNVAKELIPKQEAAQQPKKEKKAEAVE